MGVIYASALKTLVYSDEKDVLSTGLKVKDLYIACRPEYFEYLKKIADIR